MQLCPEPERSTLRLAGEHQSDLVQRRGASGPAVPHRQLARHRTKYPVIVTSPIPDKKKIMKSGALPHLLAAVVLCCASTASVRAQQANLGWKDYLGGAGSSHYSPLKQITPENVSKLEIAWTYPGGDGNYNFSPLVVDNIAYVAAKQGCLVAVDASTGKELWTHSFTGSGRGGGLGIQRGANYWESKDRTDRRLFVVSGALLHVLDARTGNLVDTFADHGKLDLKTGIDRAPIPLAPRTPGRIFEDLIILGRFTGEGYLAPPGDIRAFNVKTGKLVWVFHTIPRPGEFGYDTWPKDAYKYMGGVDVWGEITVDAKRGIVYLPVASAKYELYGGDRPGNNLYADSLLALDARTGKYLWHFQTIHHDIWDYDPTAAPQLATVKHDGKTVDIVALASKNGFLYVFDRVTGKPLWPIEERPVPKSDVPGEWTSPTQPFPTKPKAYDRQGVSEADLVDFTPEIKAAALAAVKDLRMGPMYTTSSLIDATDGTRGALVLPHFGGGTNWEGGAADPETGMLYVASQTTMNVFAVNLANGRSDIRYLF